MKLKMITVVALGLLLFSCGTKKTTTPTVSETVKKVELTPELAEGQSLYENNCGKCHKLYEPKKYTQEEWKPILTRMQKKAHLEDTQMVSISNYINSQL